MYRAEEGGRSGPVYSGWGCPCMVSKIEPLIGYDAYPILGDSPLLPGDTRTLGFYFGAEEEAAVVRRNARRFFLWEGRFIGEAQLIE